MIAQPPTIRKLQGARQEQLSWVGNAAIAGRTTVIPSAVPQLRHLQVASGGAAAVIATVNVTLVKL